MSETKPDPFAAAFSYEGEHGYCFGYEDLLHLRWRNLPQGLDEKLTQLTNAPKNPDKVKIAWLSIGLDSRYWIRYSDGKKDHGPHTDEWDKLDLWLEGHNDARVILGPRKSWLAYEAISFDSDDNVPSGLLRWMKKQKSPPTWVAMGSNATYCAIGTGDDGTGDYELSDNFLKDPDLVKFLSTAKGNHTLDGVRVSLSNVGAVGSGSLPYYVVSLGKKVCLWNVHETAENVLRSRAYSDFCEDYQREQLNVNESLTGLKREGDTRYRELNDLVGKSALKTEVETFQTNVNESLTGLKREGDTRYRELNDLVGKSALKTEIDRFQTNVNDRLNGLETNGDNRYRELSNSVNEKAVKTVVETRIGEVAALAGAVKAEVDGRLDSMQEDVNARALQEEVDTLSSRIADLEKKMKELVKPPQPATNTQPNSDTKPVPTGDTTTLGPDPPKWITKPWEENLEKLASSFGIPLGDLEAYNQKYKDKWNLDTAFWAGRKRDEAVVLVPEKRPGKRPQRLWKPSDDPIGPDPENDMKRNSGIIIAKTFGLIPEKMLARKIGHTKGPNNGFNPVRPDEIYEDCEMIIPAVEYKPNWG